MNHKILIIADDLTGAADCGIAFASSGFSTVVMLEGNAGITLTDALSIDADTRRLDPRQAAEVTEQLARDHIDAETRIVYKKLDSTLRGNVGAELAAILRAQRRLTACPVAAFAPAFPANGRTTVGGRQYLQGKPLEETEIWQRESRYDTSFIPDILADAGLRCALISLATVRSQTADLQQAIKTCAEGRDVLVFDAETDEDLRAIALGSVVLGSSTVWAGSAGLAYHLPAAVSVAAASSQVAELPKLSGPALFVVGSPAQNSREQADVLAASGMRSIAIPLSDLHAGKTASYKSEVLDTLRSRRDLLVLLAHETAGTIHSARLSSSLAAILAPCVDLVGTLVVTGGETARTVLGSWGIGALRLIEEIEPGVPLCTAENWRRPLPIITKAGAFGSPQTLLNCWHFLRSRDRVTIPGKEL